MTSQNKDNKTIELKIDKLEIKINKLGSETETKDKLNNEYINIIELFYI